MSTGDTQCPYCGIWNPPPDHVAHCWYRLPPGHTWGSAGLGPYYAPAVTEADVRRIVLEEMERAASSGDVQREKKE